MATFSKPTRLLMDMRNCSALKAPISPRWKDSAASWFKSPIIEDSHQSGFDSRGPLRPLQPPNTARKILPSPSLYGTVAIWDSRGSLTYENVKPGPVGRRPPICPALLPVKSRRGNLLSLSIPAKIPNVAFCGPEPIKDNRGKSKLFHLSVQSVKFVFHFPLQRLMGFSSLVASDSNQGNPSCPLWAPVAQRVSDGCVLWFLQSSLRPCPSIQLDRGKSRLLRLSLHL